MGLLRCIPHKVIDYLRSRLKVSLYAKGTEEGDTAVQVQESGYGNVRVSIFDHDDYVQVSAGNGDNVWVYSKGIFSVSKNFYWNESGWDRVRGNTQITLLPRAVRNASTMSPIFTNYNARGIMLFLKIYSEPGTGDTIQPRLTVASDSGEVYRIADLAAVSTVDWYRYIVYPGITSVPTLFADSAGVPLGRRFYVIMYHSGTGDFDYELCADLIL